MGKDYKKPDGFTRSTPIGKYADGGAVDTRLSFGEHISRYMKDPSIGRQLNFARRGGSGNSGRPQSSGFRLFGLVPYLGAMAKAKQIK